MERLVFRVENLFNFALRMNNRELKHHDDDHSRPQSSSLLRMTDDEKSSGEPWTKLFRYLLLVETKKARLIGQSATR